MNSKLFKFISIRVPNKHSDNASRIAALYPFFGPVVAKPVIDSPVDQGAVMTQLDYKTQRLVVLWRRRLQELKRLGWPVAIRPATFAVCMNCHPSFIAVTPTSLTCKQQTICPFCYGRVVQDLYRTVSKVCKGILASRRSDYWLLGYRQSIVIDEHSIDDFSMRHVFDTERTVRNDTYKRLQSVGGYVGTEIEPLPDGYWKIIRRGVLLTPSSIELNQAAEWADSVKRVKSPKGGDKLVKLIGWTMKYPTRLLVNGDPSSVLRLLLERKNHRLNASYGMFRKAKT